MTRFKILGTLFLILLAMASAPLSAETFEATEADWLFVQDAASGTLTGPDDQHLILTLKGIRSLTTAFTNRPLRKALALSNQQFFAAWDQAFGDDPPNATLSYRRAGERFRGHLVLKISAPSFDPMTKVIRYQAAVIHEKLESLDGHTADLPIQAPRRFGSASLFIDGSQDSY